ncbi:TonB-dependent receptor [Paracidobacterium acidisoli]|uniref:TonB-dependent receptor n=1 Tax=Paracidobacterium acidisoli TaxID=2303751 RepID=A0A372IJ78_9BACT|nr:TonB-dependent receptor [Paracidobacterium acidisoli]MBT9333241.1 TonB-dependent receptor [Paracidobacterium acidisoli]
MNLYISCIFRSSSRLRLFAALLALALFFTGQSFAQSTFGAFTGTVKDAGGSVIPGAGVVLTNTGTTAVRKAITTATGEYSFLNVDAGSYSIEVTASGFDKGEFPGLVLQARETQRVDAALSVGGVSQTVVVNAAAAVVNTDTSNLGETRTGIELDELPLAISSRGSGSTSPFATLTSQAGVQTDSTGNLSVAGSKPSLLSVTVDGISTMNVESSAPSPELFPSFASIEEIQVNQNSNNAEYGSVSDITTVSKSGTNRAHGGIYDNYETAGLNAKNPFSATKPKIVMNDFGAFYSGPVTVPMLYNGRDKTFYFLSYEGLRLPQQSTVTQSVPSLAMRGGDLSYYAQAVTPSGQPAIQIHNADGTPFAGNVIPSGDISPTAAAALAALYPMPNTGPAYAISNNYVENFPTPISSDQGDARIDQTITSKQSIFVRYSYKQRSVSVAPTASGSNGGSALVGSFARPEKDTSFTAAYNYILTPNLINELRAGLSKFITSTTFDANSSLVGKLGISGIPDLLSTSVPAAPNFVVTGFTATGGTSSSLTRSRTIQILDNLTWSKGTHTMKGGVDYRYLNAYASNVFGSSRLGKYSFNGASAVGSTINQYAPFAAFLLGYPDTTTVSDVLDANMNGYGNGYNFYVQDTWKLTPSLTLNYGLRYEYHPMMKDHQANSANFLPDYSSFQNGQMVQGAIIVPNQQALTGLTLPSFAAGVSPLPIMTAQQAGVPPSLVYTQKTDFAPRFGFAWRVFGNDKTVLRGGWGQYIENTLGGNVVGGWAVSSSALYVSANGYNASGQPVLSFPSPFQLGASAPGTLQFDYAITPHYKDPTVQQWNLTVEQDIGFNTGLRISYLGSHGRDLDIEADLNQVPYNTIGYKAAYPTRPFPELSQIPTVVNGAESNYNAVTVEANHRMSHGLQFQTSYTFTRDLSDEDGGNPTGYASSIGAYPSDRFHPGLDYGNVEYTSRHRALASFLYQLPVGRGQRFLATDNPLLDRLIGGWQLASYMMFQSGPFMTPLANTGSDPTGTGITQTVGNARADVVTGVSPYLHGQGARNYLNSAAYVEPGNNLARQGTASVGSVVGPGTDTVSASLFKDVKFTERMNFQFGAQAQNLFNHQNLAVPASLTLGTQNFGQISSVQTQGNAGPRAVMLTGRFSF